MTNKLNAKDFILIGALTALMWIICMIISTVMSVLGPTTNVFYPAVVAIPNGIIMMLLLAKVPKRGVFTICGTIQGLLFVLVGMIWVVLVALVVGGLICDLVFMSRKQVSTKSMVLGYGLFSGFFTVGAIGPINFLQDMYVATCEANGVAQAYIDGLIRMTSTPMMVLLVALGIVGGLLGGILGGRVLKKHFIKVGLVSVK